MTEFDCDSGAGACLKSAAISDRVNCHAQGFAFGGKCRITDLWFFSFTARCIASNTEYLTPSENLQTVFLTKIFYPKREHKFLS